MLRYAILTIPLFIISLIAILKQFEIPYRYALWSIIGSVLLVSIIRFVKLSLVLRILVFYLILSLLAELFAYHFADKYSNNSPVFHVFIPIQLLLFAWMYYHLLEIDKRKYLYLGFSILVFIILTLNSWSLETIWGLFPSKKFIILSCFTLPLTLLYFRSMILNPVTIKLESQPHFWLNIGTFVFFTIDFFILGFHASLGLNVPDWMYDILWGANLTLYIPYFIAIILDSQHKTTQNDSIN